MTFRKIEDSSWISSAEYFPHQARYGFIHINLSSGDTLVYGPIPCYLFGLLLASKSKGRFYNRNIRHWPYWKEDHGKYRLVG